MPMRGIRLIFDAGTTVPLSSIHKPDFLSIFLPLSDPSMPNAVVILPGPFHSPTPRMSTADGYPSVSVTILSIQYMPYTRYTYQCPGGPNMGAVLSVKPKRPWQALSSGPSYASTSVIIPSPQGETRHFPRSSCATGSTCRAKNADCNVVARADPAVCIGKLYRQSRRRLK